jgi:hypothetical protein
MLPSEAFFSSRIFFILQYRFEGKTEYLWLTKMNMLTLREQLDRNKGGSMALCPIAFIPTCNKFLSVGFAFERCALISQARKSSN